MSSLHRLPNVGEGQDTEAGLLAVTCGCGRSLWAPSEDGLVVQVSQHWGARHPELSPVAAADFVVRHTYRVGEVD